MATVQNIIDEVRRVIHDGQAPFRWVDFELIDYINAGNRQTVQLISKANSVEVIFDTLTSRVARQELPAGGIQFIKAARNYADDGSTPQGVIRDVEKDSLDSFEPDWEFVSTKADGDNYFEHYCHDKREPVTFYLYPAPVEDNKRVAIVYSAIPVVMTDNADTLPLAGEYQNALVQYVTYRALTKESRETLPDAFRQDLWQNYLVALGLQERATDRIVPSNNRAPDSE